MADEPGVLGGLPRSRPGRRSARREATTGAGGRPAKKPSERSSATTKAAEATSPSRATTPRGASNERPDRDGEDVLTGAARAAVSVGGAGLRAASRLASGAIRRLPRP